ncbi:M48 family metallopeptidase [Sphingomicrobium sediminis]|uniref:M48 family metallopeptidase n=1 Tax=Sphingomicrobium sediminis TaxID=2950949 RepID=A0A9X2EIG1_9SPHN|nr:M48 family metallopeptidase [Sphingomicrobium sediminis]
MSSEHRIDTVEPPIAVDVRRHARSRRFSLRYDAAKDRLRLTVPKRGSIRAALKWAGGETAWIAKQRAACPERSRLLPGSNVDFDGETLQLVHDANATRRVERRDNLLVTGGPVETAPRRYAKWLAEGARDLLSDDVAFFAERAGVAVGKVAVGNARTRWGSCSSDGTIRFNWRLACAPPAVRRYVAAHEVAHRVHMDHGPAFKRLEAEIFDGDIRAAKADLKRLGPELQLIGS